MTLALALALVPASFAGDAEITWSVVGTSYAYADGDDYTSLTKVLDVSKAICDVDVETATGLSSHGTCGGSASNLGFQLSVAFSVCEDTAYEFRMGPDYGRGGALFFDEVLVDGSKDDLWWNANWSATTELLTGTGKFARGSHTVDAIGFEGCCDGNQAMQFRAEGGEWADVSSTALANDDDDCDGVTNDADACPDTAEGDVVDATGCAIAQICPCDDDWKNHGQYVSCVAHATNDFVADGLLTGAEKGVIQSEAGASACGK